MKVVIPGGTGQVGGLLTAAGFEFRHGTWPEAARDLVQRARDRDAAGSHRG